MDTDPLPPVHEDDPYYFADPADDDFSDLWDDEEDSPRWDQEVGVQWETR